MKFTDKFKAKKTENQENPANESPKKEKKPLKQKIKDSMNKKYLKNGSYSVVISAIFIVIVLVINMIVGSLPTKYTEVDVSSEKLYSISDDTKKFLKKLDKDITIYQVVQSGSEDETIKKLLEKYGEESDHIKVEQKDPVVNPKFTSEYTSDDVDANSLIVVCGDRSKVVNYSSIYESSIDYNTYQSTTTGFDGEGQIDSAISYVTSEDLPVLYTLDGHGEKDLDSTLQEDIQKANIDIKSLNLITEESVPDDAACLLINAPTSDISESEKDAILDYLENGGKAMIFSDYTEESMDNFDAVLKNYGVERTEGIVIEGDSQHYAQMPYYLVPTVNSTDAVSDFASKGYYVLMPYAQGIKKTDDVRDTVTINSLLTTSDSAYSKVDVNSGTIEKTDDDIDGPFDLGVSITEKLDNDKETQIVDISVPSRQYDFQETFELFDNYRDKLISELLAGNKSIEEIKSPLNFISKIGEEGLTINWEIENELLIDYSGEIHPEYIDSEGAATYVIANLSLGDYNASLTIPLILVP